MYNSILYATDLNNEHTCLAEKAAKLAKQLQAKLYLLHVIELPTSIQLGSEPRFYRISQTAKDDAITVLSLLGDSLGIPSAHNLWRLVQLKNIFYKKPRN